MWDGKSLRRVFFAGLCQLYCLVSYLGQKKGWATDKPRINHTQTTLMDTMPCGHKGAKRDLS